MNQKLRNLVYTAMLIALCCVATLVIKIPTVTGGYLNAGDIVVVLAALLAGPLYGGVAAGFGSGLADVISGYMSYAPGTRKQGFPSNAWVSADLSIKKTAP